MCHFLFMHNFIMLLNICIIIMRNRWVFHKKVQNVSMPLFHAITSIFFCELTVKDDVFSSRRI